MDGAGGKNLSLTTCSIVLAYISAFLLLGFKLDITSLPVFPSYKNFLDFVNLQPFRIQ